MTITPGRDVGVGDAAPDSNYGSNLSVHSTATDGARLKLSDGSTGKTNTDGLDIISTGSVAYFINRENADMVFYTNNTERLRIDSSGNVGIDFIPKSLHANVTSSLNVGSSSLFQRTKNSYVSSNFYYNSSDIGKSIASGYAPVYQQDVTNGAHVWFKTNNASAADETISLSEAMRITSSGDVGIGNNDPGTLLHVSSSNNGAVRIGGNNAGSTGLTITYDNSSFTTTTILQNYRATNGNALLDIDTGTFKFTGTSGTEDHINAGGNMGLGSNSPTFSSFGSNTGGIEISDVNTNNAPLVQSG